jgi:hypothetical protein
MAYLNLKTPEFEKAITLGVVPAVASPRPGVNSEKTLITLTLSPEALARWVQELKLLWPAKGEPDGKTDTHAELRVDLPQNWIVFCKARPTGTRLLVAHPERGEWVTTVAIEQRLTSMLTQALESFARGESSEQFDVNAFLSEHTRIDGVSNVTLVIRR